jgi:hypothetical protein
MASRFGASRERGEMMDGNLRDQFAMAAITGIVQNNQLLAQINRIEGIAVEAVHMARAAYNIADAMMQVREKALTTAQREDG